jgi:Protein of unknown function (DUF2865)
MMMILNMRSLGFCAVALLAGVSAAAAQGALPPPPGTIPNQSPVPGQNPVCSRLEGQLAQVNRGITDPARADQAKRYEDAVNKQQAELDRMVGQSRKMGCEGLGFFSLFGGQPAQCGPLNSQVQQMRANLDRMMSDLQRLQGADVDRDGQRQSIVVALAQNNCGPQYRAQVTQQNGGFFDQLFGTSNNNNSSGGYSTTPDAVQSSTFRTLCVRTCDGFYYPISFSTTPARFQDDEQICQRTCPNAEVMLFSHRNPGEDVSQAVSISGKHYTELPQAFHYRQEVNPACSCRRPGQSWAEALGQTRDSTLERGDVVVTDDKSRSMSQQRFDAQGRPIKPDPRNATATPQPGAATDPAAASDPASEPGKRTVRAVGPTFVPAR